MKLTPLFDRVILKPKDFKKEEFKGLIIPSGTDKPKTAVVVSVGKDVSVVKQNDKVVFASYAGIEFDADGETLIIIKETDIIGIMEEENE